MNILNRYLKHRHYSSYSNIFWGDFIQNVTKSPSVELQWIGFVGSKEKMKQRIICLFAYFAFSCNDTIVAIQSECCWIGALVFWCGRKESMKKGGLFVYLFVCLLICFLHELHVSLSVLILLCTTK